MLIVRRRVGEAIIIADDVEIHIVEISKTRVKLGITAPREVSILRREVLEVASENRTAASFFAGGSLDGDLIRLLRDASRKMPQMDSGAVDM